MKLFLILISIVLASQTLATNQKSIIPEKKLLWVHDRETNSELQNNFDEFVNSITSFFVMIKNDIIKNGFIKSFKLHRKFYLSILLYAGLYLIYRSGKRRNL